jgi:uncharacterized membrane protein
MTRPLPDRTVPAPDEDRPPRRWPARTFDPLAVVVGWASLAAGVLLVAAPQRIARLLGMGAVPGAGVVTRSVGLRHLVSGVGILASRRPVGWLWFRAVGDVADLALLGVGAAIQGRGRPLLGRWLAHHRRPAPVTIAAMATAGVVAVVDQAVAIRLTRHRGPHRSASVTVTVERPQEEVYRRWRELQDFPRFMSHLELRPASARPAARPGSPGPTGAGAGWDADVVNEVPGQLIEWRSTMAADVDHAGTVTFEPDPSGRGTRVTVRVDYRPPGGLLGSLIAGLFGEHPRQQISDDLLRFKHVLETAPD